MGKAGIADVYVVFVLRCFSHVQLFATQCTIAQEAPLSMGFSRQEYWSGLPCPPPGDLPNPGIEPESLLSPALVGRFFITSTPGKPDVYVTPSTFTIPSPESEPQIPTLRL